MKRVYHIFFILSCILCFLFATVTAKATDHNILPRFPEIVIEKSYSQFFKVKDCQAKASIENDIAVTSLKAVLANVSDKEVASSVKFRILYPSSVSKITINVNGKSFKYDPENPRYSFSLKPNEEIKFEMNANVYINYSIDAVRRAIKRKEEEEKAGVKDARSVKEKGQDIANSFLRFFKSNDRYGKRFQIGSLISKWGLFPVDFEKINVEIKVPENFTVITSSESAWQDVKKAKRILTYKTSDTENYSDAIFLPEADKEEQLKTMEILKSDYFKR